MSPSDEEGLAAKVWEASMRKGYVRLLVLAFLSRRRLTGYDIMKEVRDKTLGFWRITPGGIYPALKELESRGLIKGDWEYKGKRRRRVYEITEMGRRTLSRILERHHRIVETIQTLIREVSLELLGVKLPPVTSRFPMLQFWMQLKKRSASEQALVLRRVRRWMVEAIRRIDERLKELEATRG